MFAWLFHRKVRDQDANPRERALWGDLMSLGMVFPLCIVLGWLGGGWVGTHLGYPRLGKLLGLGFGIAAAFWELIKVTQRLDRSDPPSDDRNAQP